MKKLLLILTFSFILFSCKKTEVEPTENLKDSLIHDFPDPNWKPGMIKG